VLTTKFTHFSLVWNKGMSGEEREREGALAVAGARRKKQSALEGKVVKRKWKR